MVVQPVSGAGRSVTTDAARPGWSHPFGDVVVGGVPKAIELRLDASIADPSRDEARVVELQRTLARVSAPEVAQIRNVRVEAGRLILRFDAFAGTPVSELVGSGRPAAARVIAIVHGVARALAAAHREGALHRGLSAASVLVGPRDEVRVLDFGVGLLLKQDSNARALKLDPLTPERVFGLPPAAADDVYLLGCLGYLLATGEPPLVDDDAARLRRRHAIEDPPRLARTPNLAIPSSLAKLIDRCLAKDPEDRFESIEALVAELPPLPAAAVAPLLGAGARVPPPPPTAKPPVVGKPASERSSPVVGKPASERSSPAADKPASERSSPAADKPASERCRRRWTSLRRSARRRRWTSLRRSARRRRRTSLRRSARRRRRTSLRRSARRRRWTSLRRSARRRPRRRRPPFSRRRRPSPAIPPHHRQPRDRAACPRPPICSAHGRCAARRVCPRVPTRSCRPPPVPWPSCGRSCRHPRPSRRRRARARRRAPSRPKARASPRPIA
ncbi:MAG: protein kinase [Nannocystaceae bacterium]